jgi:hypothetical protein
LIHCRAQKAANRAIVPHASLSLLVFAATRAYGCGATAFHLLNAKLHSPSASGAWPGHFQQMCPSAPLKHVLERQASE